MPAGRPSDYDPEYCEQIIALGRQGLHVYQMAERLDVGSATLYRWEDNHEEFREAFTRAREYSKAKLLDVVDDNYASRDFQPKLVEMKVKFLSDHTRCRKIELASTPVEKMGAVEDAMNSGERSAEVGKALIESIKARITAEQDAELRPMLEKLQAQFDDNHKLK